MTASLSLRIPCKSVVGAPRCAGATVRRCPGRIQALAAGGAAGRAASRAMATGWGRAAVVPPGRLGRRRSERGLPRARRDEVLGAGLEPLVETGDRLERVGLAG